VVNLTALARDGSRVRLVVVRRLLFERGRPVAVQDAGPVLDDPEDAGASPGGNPDHQKSGESSRFAEQLKQLHRLSTATTSLWSRPSGITGNGVPALPSASGRFCFKWKAAIQCKAAIPTQGFNGLVQASFGAEGLKGA